MIVSGWPDRRNDVPIEVQQVSHTRDELVACDGIVFKGSRIVTLPSLWKQMLTLIHESHLGIVKYKQRARELMVWSSTNSEIENKIKNCSKCADYKRKPCAEPVLATLGPNLPSSRS